MIMFLLYNSILCINKFLRLANSYLEISSNIIFRCYFKMSKTPITWLELIKMKLSEEKSKGKSPSIGDVTPLAKKEWVQIKEGKHPLYIQGKAKTYARKKGKGEKKTRKNASASASASESAESPMSSKSSKSASASSSKSASASSSASASLSSPGSAMDIKALLAEIKLCGPCKKKINKMMKKKGMSGGSCGGTCMPAAA